MLCGIKLLKNVAAGVGGRVRLCVCGNLSDVCAANTKETDGKQMIMAGYDTCTGVAACL